MPSAIFGLFQVSYVFPPPVLVPLVLSNFLAEHVNSQLRHLILVASYWMEAPWLPTVLNMFCRHFSMVSHHKKSHCGWFYRPGAQGPAISTFNPLAAQWCVLCRQGFSFSVSQAVVGATQMSTPKVYEQFWKELAGWCVWQVVPNNIISAPKLGHFWCIYFRLGWPGIQLVYIILLFLPFWSLIILTRLLLVLSSQN